MMNAELEVVDVEDGETSDAKGLFHLHATGPASMMYSYDHLIALFLSSHEGVNNAVRILKGRESTPKSPRLLKIGDTLHPASIRGIMHL
jgi:hypothetical protein